MQKNILKYVSFKLAAFQRMTRIPNLSDLIPVSTTSTFRIMIWEHRSTLEMVTSRHEQAQNSRRNCSGYLRRKQQSGVEFDGAASEQPTRVRQTVKSRGSLRVVKDVCAREADEKQHVGPTRRRQRRPNGVRQKPIS